MSNMTVIYSESTTIAWKEVNPEFVPHDRLPHDDHDDDNNTRAKDEGYRNIVFDFEEIDGDIPITLRTKTASTSESTGLALWTCSQILSGYLVDNPHHVRDKRVLELGAGLGLCGIVAHKLGANQVLATDGDVDVLHNLRYNAQRNKTDNDSQHLACPQLVWGQNLGDFTRRHKKQSVILATDVFYSPGLVKPLWRTVDHLLEHDGRFLLAFAPHAVSIEHVLDEARDWGFTWACPDITASSDVEEKDGEEKDDDGEDCFDDFTPNANEFGYHVFQFKRMASQ
eukprot:scaffold1123_cov168-Amphora_coffeaeformis.AAC.42